MKKGLLIFLTLFAFVCASAQTDSLLVAQAIAMEEILAAADSLAAAETAEISDDEILMMLATPQADTVKKVIDKGYNVSRHINAKRQRSEDYTEFSVKPAFANTFISARLSTMKLLSKDYGFGNVGGLTFGKWVHEDHAVRLDFGAGMWQDNFDGAEILGLDATATYMFNLSSYVGGYRTNRLAEVYVVAGAGYANSIHRGQIGHAFKGQVGMNLNLRLYKHLDFFIEPMAVVYSNAMAASYAGNWRLWMSAFQGSFGFTANILRSKSPDSPNVMPRTDGWFVSWNGGPHIQNSEFVFVGMDWKKALGVHFVNSVGKHYNNFFAVRYSAAYSRGAWIQYDDKTYPCNYFAARAECMVDIVDMLRRAVKASNTNDAAIALSLIAGPEAGYMYKVDAESEVPGHVPVVETHYIGFTGGVQAKVRVARRAALFLEPRFSLVPYDAPNLALLGQNKFLNFYDTVLNANFGVEFLL